MSKVVITNEDFDTILYIILDYKQIFKKTDSTKYCSLEWFRNHLKSTRNVISDKQFAFIEKHKDVINNDIPVDYQEKVTSYRPFKDCSELILEWEKKLGSISLLGEALKICPLQEPFIWVKHKADDRRRMIVGYGENFVEIGVKAKPVTLGRLFEMYTFLDGTPCGVKEEHQNENK